MSRPAPTRPERVTFRLPFPALLFPVLLLFCIVPLATVGGAWGVLYVVPVAALTWVIVTRTRATPSEVTAYGLLGAKRMAWTEMAGLELKDARWATAVGLDGRRLRLPMVRPRDLPRLAAVSGGSLNLGGAVRDGEPTGERTPVEDAAPVEPGTPADPEAPPQESPDLPGPAGDGQDPADRVPGQSFGDESLDAEERRSRTPTRLAPTMETPTSASAPAAPNAPSV
jgi:hypothetical protein